MTSQQLVPAERGGDVALREPAGNLGDLMRAGKILAASGFFKDAKVEAQAVAKILAGAELGIGPVAALRGVQIIDGQVALAAGLVGALIKRSRPRYDYQIVESTAVRCELSFYEQSKHVGGVVYTIEEAKAAGLTVKPNWQHYPADMLFSRAITRGARRFTPDLFLGPVYTPEELGDGGVYTQVDGPPPSARVSDLYDPGLADGVGSRPMPEASAIPGQETPPRERTVPTPSQRAAQEQAMREAEAAWQRSAPPDDDRRLMSKFWARATGKPPGGLGLDKAAVHALFGLTAQNGELAKWVAQPGHSWAMALDCLEAAVAERAEPDEESATLTDDEEPEQGEFGLGVPTQHRDPVDGIRNSGRK